MRIYPILAAWLGSLEGATVLLALIAGVVVVALAAIFSILIYQLFRRRQSPPNQPVIAVPAVASPEEPKRTIPSHCPHCGKPVPPTALGGICPECMLKAGLAAQTEGPDSIGPQGTKIIPPPASPAEIAPLFPQLEVLECLGHGGMGVVYKARQPRLNRLVALKILGRDKDQDAQFAGRFAREAQALARLNHPNIVTVHDFGEAGGHCYLVMEYVDGVNLRQLLVAGKMPPEQALKIVPKICEALQYAHEQGVIHRDIKPENILLDKQGRVKIADFGIAKMAGTGAGQPALTGAKDVVGTPHYMAPEQIEKPATVDHRADIYSLGVVFYEMLTGELPLGKFAPPSSKVQIDVRLDEVVLHSLEKEPSRRYQHASEVKTRVETIAATSPGDRSPKAYESIRNSLKAPARGLIAAGVLQLLFALGLSAFAIPAVIHESGGLLGCAVIGIIAVFFLIPTTVVLLGAASMLKLQRHTLTVVASVVGAVAGPAAILGLPFGVWALVILFRPEVRAAFEANRLPTGPTATPDSGKMDFARSQVKGPAIGLVVTGVLDWVLFTVVCIVAAFKSAGSLFIWLPFLAMALSGWIIYAGLKFRQLERRGAVMLGSVLAMIVSPGNIIGLPIGIWALVVLNRREVRAAFTANRSPAGSPGTPLEPAPDQSALSSLAIAALLLAGLSGILGITGFWFMPQPPTVLVWSILACALAGIVLGVSIHSFRIGRLAIAIGGVTTAIWLALALAVNSPYFTLHERELAQRMQNPGNVIAQTIQHEVGRQLREAGATYDDLQATVASNRDSGTPYKVIYRGLQNFKGADGTTPVADGAFIMEYTGAGQWQGKLAGTPFTVAVGSKDNIDLPFVNDPEVIGEWESVDFVANPSEFNPDKPKWSKDKLFLKGLTFLENGKMPQSWMTWTKGVVMHHGDKTASQYQIREIDGQAYLFFEWKSGDVTIRGMKPPYYVLKKKL